MGRGRESKQNAKAKKKRRRQTGSDEETAKPVQQQKTLDNMREKEETMVQSDDEEVMFDEAHDEMSNYFNRESTPKILITGSSLIAGETWKLCHELRRAIPNSRVYKRQHVPLKKLVKQAIKADFTDVIVVNQDRKKPNGMIMCHLPHGPTAHFKLGSVTLSDAMRGCGKIDHNPEIILNNFKTRLGHLVGRMLASLFPHDPHFTHRRVITFHNQRDFIFFRHHRYEFKKEGSKVALAEMGPRFTLKLRSLQNGVFDTKEGQFEWIHKRHEMETSRRKFFL